MEKTRRSTKHNKYSLIKSLATLASTVMFLFPSCSKDEKEPGSVRSTSIPPKTTSIEQPQTSELTLVGMQEEISRRIRQGEKVLVAFGVCIGYEKEWPSDDPLKRKGLFTVNNPVFGEFGQDQLLFLNHKLKDFVVATGPEIDGAEATFPTESIVVTSSRVSIQPTQIVTSESGYESTSGEQIMEVNYYDHMSIADAYLACSSISTLQ